MKIEKINKVCFVGAGTMGCFNALTAAIAGYQVTIYDLSLKTLMDVDNRQKAIGALLINHGLATPSIIDDAMTRVLVEKNLEKAVAEAELISESVFEDVQIKRDVHRRLDELCEKTTLITTNTSNLLVSQIEDVLQHGERFAALHSHLGSPLVDIVAGPRTSADVTRLLQRYVSSLGGVPLVLEKENPGYVLNAMLGPLLTTAMQLVIAGVASKEQVDRAWMLDRDAAMGPFGMMDLFGINIIFDSWKRKPENADLNHQKIQVLSFLTPFIERNELGMKTGKGFYQYPNPDYQKSDFILPVAAVELSRRALITPLIANAIALVDKKILAPADIDRAWMAGTHLAQGPFSMLEDIGIAEYQVMLGEQCRAGLCSAELAATAERYFRESDLYQEQLL